MLQTHAPVADYYPPIEKRKKEGGAEPLEKALGKFAPGSTRAPRLLLVFELLEGEPDLSPYKSLCRKTTEVSEEVRSFRVVVEKENVVCDVCDKNHFVLCVLFVCCLLFVVFGVLKKDYE